MMTRSGLTASSPDGETIREALIVTGAGKLDDPPKRQRHPSVRPDLHRHLVRRAAHTARPHFDRRHDILKRLMEQVDRALLFESISNVLRLLDASPPLAPAGTVIQRVRSVTDPDSNSRVLTFLVQKSL